MTNGQNSPIRLNTMWNPRVVKMIFFVYCNSMDIDFFWKQTDDDCISGLPRFYRYGYLDVYGYKQNVLRSVVLQNWFR